MNANDLSRIEQQRFHSLQFDVQLHCLDLFEQAKAKLGLNLFLAQGTRTFAEQAAIYAQGRTEAGHIVTHARPGQSWHNFGVAFDVAIKNGDGSLDWNIPVALGEVGESLGLEWGGRWKSFPDPDENHFQSRRHEMTLAQASAYWPRGWELV